MRRPRARQVVRAVRIAQRAPQFRSLRRAGYVSLTLIAVTASSCFFGDPPPSGEAGVRRDEGGRIEVRLRACEPAREVTELRLMRATGTPGQDGHILWQVVSDDGGPQGNYLVGGTPEGFRERVPLQAPLADQDTFIIASMLGAAVRPRQVFKPADLRLNHWLVSGGRFVTTTEFDALDVCHP